MRFTTGPSEPSPQLYATPRLSMTSVSGSISSVSITSTPFFTVMEPVTGSSTIMSSSSVFFCVRCDALTAALCTRSASFHLADMACTASSHSGPGSADHPASSSATRRGFRVATIVMPVLDSAEDSLGGAYCDVLEEWAAQSTRSSANSWGSSASERSCGSSPSRSTFTSPFSADQRSSTVSAGWPLMSSACSGERCLSSSTLSRSRLSRASPNSITSWKSSRTLTGLASARSMSYSRRSDMGSE
mmetsp:Transcript_7117/g.25082  ORF Transcript_7117/g.25082 Transcript_7117/m.25082 type:complete len:245 (+) Transcript_7117:856-1590(+)